MHNMNLDKLFYRIILGYYYIYINNNKYKVTYPDISIKYEAEIIYDEAIEDNKFNKFKRLINRENLNFKVSKNMLCVVYFKKLF